MGSSGSGRFGTYQIRNGQIESNINRNVGNGIGGEVGEVECPSVIENIRLEDVATSEYYINHQTIPSPGDLVALKNTIHKGRLVVNTSATGEILGNLPTQYNFLISCIKKGMRYTGTVIASGVKPIPFIVVTLHG